MRKTLIIFFFKVFFSIFYLLSLIFNFNFLLVSCSVQSFIVLFLFFSMSVRPLIHFVTIHTLNSSQLIRIITIVICYYYYCYLLLLLLSVIIIVICYYYCYLLLFLLSVIIIVINVICQYR